NGARSRDSRRAGIEAPQKYNRATQHPNQKIHRYDMPDEPCNHESCNQVSDSRGWPESADNRAQEQRKQCVIPELITEAPQRPIRPKRGDENLLQVEQIAAKSTERLKAGHTRREEVRDWPLVKRGGSPQSHSRLIG